MTQEFNEFQIESLTKSAEAAYFSDYLSSFESNEYSSHFDCYSTFDENDYEYQQDLASSLF